MEKSNWPKSGLIQDGVSCQKLIPGRVLCCSDFQNIKIKSMKVKQKFRAGKKPMEKYLICNFTLYIIWCLNDLSDWVFVQTLIDYLKYAWPLAMGLWLLIYWTLHSELSWIHFTRWDCRTRSDANFPKNDDLHLSLLSDTFGSRHHFSMPFSGWVFGQKTFSTVSLGDLQ